MRYTGREGLLGIVALSIVMQAGCGLVFQGYHQTLKVTSAPEGATVTDGSKTLTTPTEMTVSRRKSSTPSILRFKKDGLYSACRLLEWQSDPLLVTLDSIPAAIPLLLDLAFRTFPGRYKDVAVPMDQLPPGYADIVPSNEQVMDALNRGINLCDPPAEVLALMRLRSRFGDKASKVLALAGEPSKSYAALGQVDVRTRGANWWAWNFFALSGFSNFSFRHYQFKESHAEINEMLKLKALELFGERLDAVVNIQYEDLPGNDVSATGVAVRFVDAAEPTRAHSSSSRLVELRHLFDDGVINHDEYEKKRKAILSGL
ncbi:MAG TPA: SHOCT domain-containing protein [Candidatus Margulisiibacteriota bacterium]|nr:SHOCT domain-containing protein [Candidatus Margulisiibacteriota bacterium]